MDFQIYSSLAGRHTLQTTPIAKSDINVFGFIVILRILSNENCSLIINSWFTALCLVICLHSRFSINCLFQMTSCAHLPVQHTQIQQYKEQQVCFLLFQVTAPPLNIEIYPEVDLQSFKSSAQSASFLKMRERNWTLSLRNVFFWGMDLQAKAIVCMILQKIKVIFSCDVVFNEQKFGHDDSGQETESQKYVYFDCFGCISDSDSHTVEGSLNRRKSCKCQRRNFCQ